MIVGLGFIGVASYLLATLKKEDPNYKTILGFGIFFTVAGAVIFLWNLVDFMLKRMLIAPQPNASVTQNPVFAPANNRVPNSRYVRHPNNTVNMGQPVAE